MEALPEAVQLRLSHGEASVDGILCWDFFDFLKKPAAQKVAKHLVDMLRPGGAIMGYFAISDVERSNFMKYEIVDDQSMRHRQHVGSRCAACASESRDHPDVRRTDRRRVIPAEEQLPRNPAAQEPNS